MIIIRPLLHRLFDSSFDAVLSARVVRRLAIEQEVRLRRPIPTPFGFLRLTGDNRAEVVLEDGIVLTVVTNKVLVRRCLTYSTARICIR